MKPNLFKRNFGPVVFSLMVVALASLSKPGFPQAGQNQQTPAVTLLKPARVFDAEDGKVHDGWVVLVRGERIATVGPAAEVRVPEGARTIDLAGMTLLPGLMDIHSHIFLHPYNETLWNEQVLKEPPAYRTIEAVKHCEQTLMAGFTLLRDLGTEGRRSIRRDQGFLDLHGFIA